MKLLQMCICDKQRYSFNYNINKNTKGLNIRHRKTTDVHAVEINIILNI